MYMHTLMFGRDYPKLSVMVRMHKYDKQLTCLIALKSRLTLLSWHQKQSYSDHCHCFCCCDSF